MSYFYLKLNIFWLIFPQINPSTFINENYYEVDGVLTTKLEQIDMASKPKITQKCPEDDAKAIIGKNGVHYFKHQAFCLETQKFPDAVHHVSKILIN